MCRELVKAMPNDERPRVGRTFCESHLWTDSRRMTLPNFRTININRKGPLLGTEDRVTRFPNPSARNKRKLGNSLTA